MQNTLLGLAIAFILALTAALVGPYFVDWTRFRPGFEAEASRIVGLPVRVRGDMVARILPTPTLRLRDVEIGTAGEGRRMRAAELDVEFNLGSLMRGEWRAEELAVKGVDAELGLDLRGQMNSFAASSGFNLGALAIDRVNMAGRLTLRDAASRTNLVLDDISFSGDVRSLAGSIRGEGSFTFQDTRYPYRLSSGQTTDNKGVRMRFSIDPGDRLVMADADGVLSFEDGAPHFEGNVTLGRPVGLKAAQGQTDASLQSPWRVTAKVKADPAEAKFEQVDILYGSDDAGLRLGGLADIRFGASPDVQTVLAARQFDADRFLTQRGVGTPPMQLLQSLAMSLGALPRPPMPVRADISADSLTLGGRPVQGLGLDLRGDNGGWSIERLEFRAPGAPRVALSGRLDQSATTAAFKGTVGLEANDPDLVFSWLQGRNDVARPGRALRAGGEIAVAADRFAIDRLRLEMDGGTVEGRVAFLGAAAPGTRSRLDADLKADRFDLDTVMRIASSAEGAGVWPGEARVALDVGRATLLGQEARGINARLVYDDKAWTLERVAIADLGGATLDGSGMIDRGAASGRVAIDAKAPSLEKLAVLVTPLSPMLAARLRAVPDRSAAAGLKFTLQVERPSPAQASARINIETTGPVAGTLTATASPAASSLQTLDSAGLLKTPLSIEAKWTAPRAETLMALFGLDRIMAARSGGELTLKASGPLSGTLRGNVALKAEGLELRGEGDVNPLAQTSAFDLNIQRANIAPLFGLARLDNPALDLTLRSRVAYTGLDTKFENTTATLGAARMRGRVTAVGPDATLDGEVGVDTLDVGGFLRLAIGDGGAGASDQLSRGLIGRWRGRIAFQALGAKLGDRIELRPLAGVAVSDGTALTFNSLSGNLGGGTVTGDVTARGAADGVALDGRLQLANIDGTMLRVGQLAMPAGRVSAQLSLQGTGRSTATLIGSLSGNGTISIKDAQLTGLDPIAFESAIRASDQGVRDASRIRDVVDRGLATGRLAMPATDFPVSVRAGRARLDSTSVAAGPVQLSVSGGYDLTTGEIDLRTSLVSTVSTASQAAGRPEIRVALRGAADAPSRDIDVAPLMGWLAVRAIERETQRLDQLDRNAPPMGGGEPVITSTTPPSANEPELIPAPPSLIAPMPMPMPRPQQRAAPQPAAPTVRGADQAPVSTLPSLPPPIDVRPPPGGLKRSPAPRPPTPLAPNAARPQNQSAF